MKLLLAFIASLAATTTMASDVEIVNVQANQSGSSWRFDVTLKHADSGWDHYADGWEILTPDGASLGLRVLVHPHETEQPFTRSLGGIVIPEGLSEVIIRARDNVEGWTEQTYMFELP